MLSHAKIVEIECIFGSGLQQDLVVLEQQDLDDLEQQDLVPDQTRPKNTSDFHYFVMNEHPIGAMKV